MKRKGKQGVLLLQQQQAMTVNTKIITVISLGLISALTLADVAQISSSSTLMGQLQANNHDESQSIEIAERGSGRREQGTLPRTL